MLGCGTLGSGYRNQRRTGAGTSFAAHVTGLTHSVLHGLHAQVGTTLTGNITSLQGGETIVHRWQTSQGVIAGATADSFTPTPDLDLETLTYAPLVDGTPVISPASLVRHAAPVAGTLAPVNAVQGSGQTMVVLSAGFTGADLTYSQTEPWATITGDVLTLDDAVRDATLTITATNSGGVATVPLDVSIVSAPTFALEAIGEEPVITITSGNISLTFDQGPYAGSYTTDYQGAILSVASVTAAPVCLVLPQVAVTQDTLTVTPSLRLYEGDDKGDQVIQQQLDGVDIPGGTGLSYTPQPEDIGKTFTVIETYGGVSVTSAPLVVSAQGLDLSYLGAKRYLVLDMTKPDNLFTDAARTEPVTQDYDGIEGFADSSGNDRHVRLSPVGQKSILWDDIAKQARVFLQPQTVPNAHLSGVTAASGLTDGMELYVAMNTDKPQGMFMSTNENGSRYVAAFLNGNGTSPPYSGVGSNVVLEADGTALPGTSFDVAHDTWSTGQPVVVSARGLDLSSWNGNTLRFLHWQNTGFRYDVTGRITAIVLTQTLTAAERTQLISDLQTTGPAAPVGTTAATRDVVGIGDSFMNGDTKTRSLLDAIGDELARGHDIQTAGLNNQASGGTGHGTQAVTALAQDLSNSVLVWWDGYGNGYDSSSVANYMSQIADVAAHKADGRWLYMPSVPINVAAGLDPAYLQFLDDLWVQLHATYTVSSQTAFVAGANIFDPRPTLQAMFPGDTAVAGLPLAAFRSDNVHLGESVDQTIARAVAAQIEGWM